MIFVKTTQLFHASTKAALGIQKQMWLGSSNALSTNAGCWLGLV